MREAVAREIEPTVWTAYDEVRRQYKGIWKYTEQDCAYFADKLANTTERRARSLKCADAILSGPIASEIARLTGERDAAREAVALCNNSFGSYSYHLNPHPAEQIEKVKAQARSEWRRAEAAEAETARLRAERLTLDKRIHDQRVALRQNWEITEMRNKDHHRAAVRTRLLAICCRLRAELNEARAALTSQEKTDV